MIPTDKPWTHGIHFIVCFCLTRGRSPALNGKLLNSARVQRTIQEKNQILFPNFFLSQSEEDFAICLLRSSLWMQIAISNTSKGSLYSSFSVLFLAPLRIIIQSISIFMVQACFTWAAELRCLRSGWGGGIIAHTGNQTKASDWCLTFEINQIIIKVHCWIFWHFSTHGKCDSLKTVLALIPP